MHSVTKIISGAQIGADIAGLKAAKLLGLETGGYVLKNCKTLDGNKPEWITLYGLTELASVSYLERTALNVKHSDGTGLYASRMTSTHAETSALCGTLNFGTSPTSTYL